MTNHTFIGYHKDDGHGCASSANSMEFAERGARGMGFVTLDELENEHPAGYQHYLRIKQSRDLMCQL